jgi:hypothetical protein
VADRKRRRNRLLGIVAAAGLCVLVPAVTLGSITTWAAYMDLHGLTAAMRVAVVGAVACVVVPLGVWVASTVCHRIDAKTHRAHLAALNSPRHAAHHPRGNR